MFFFVHILIFSEFIAKLLSSFLLSSLSTDGDWRTGVGRSTGKFFLPLLLPFYLLLSYPLLLPFYLLFSSSSPPPFLQDHYADNSPFWFLSLFMVLMNVAKFYSHARARDKISQMWAMTITLTSSSLSWVGSKRANVITKQPNIGHKTTSFNTLISKYLTKALSCSLRCSFLMFKI